MKLSEALHKICQKQIPKEINGVKTKYIIHEFSFRDIPSCSVTILPINLHCDNLSVAIKYCNDWYIGYDITPTTLAYKQLARDIQELLCGYIRNIISYMEGAKFDDSM